jgi:hypothetical protein
MIFVQAGVVVGAVLEDQPVCENAEPRSDSEGGAVKEPAPVA